MSFLSFLSYLDVLILIALDFNLFSFFNLYLAPNEVYSIYNSSLKFEYMAMRP